MPPPVPSPYSDQQNYRHTVSFVLILFFLRQIQPFSLSFLKSKTLTIEFSFHQPNLHPYTVGKNPTENIKRLEVKPQSQSARLIGKKIKNFYCPCIHSLQSENVFQFLYRLVFSLLFSLCINYDQFFIIWLIFLFSI